MLIFINILTIIFRNIWFFLEKDIHLSQTLTISIWKNYWKIQFGSSSTIAVFSDLGWYNGCYYEAIGEEIKVSECNDSAGTIPYEDYKSKIASQEEHAKQAYLNISKEFAKTDYKISDLFLGF